MVQKQKRSYFTAARVFTCFSIFLAFALVSYIQGKKATPHEFLEIPEVTSNKIEKMIDVGGRRLHCCVYGKGNPTVVLVSGFGAPQVYWNSAIPALSGLTTVFTYDRAWYARREA